ncbi:MAG: hypothetical protein KGV48_003015 [Alcaligenaceae bacterium]|nr:hypothetical protein [Alcaligenaceae bacterium]
MKQINTLKVRISQHVNEDHKPNIPTLLVYMMGIVGTCYLLVQPYTHPTWTQTSLKSHIQQKVSILIQSSQDSESNNSRNIIPLKTAYEPTPIYQGNLTQLLQLNPMLKGKLIELYQILYQKYQYQLALKPIKIDQQNSDRVAHHFLKDGVIIKEKNIPWIQEAYNNYGKTAETLGFYWGGRLTPPQPDIISLQSLK